MDLMEAKQDCDNYEAEMEDLRQSLDEFFQTQVKDSAGWFVRFCSSLIPPSLPIILSTQ